jgi:hypothetical protein
MAAALARSIARFGEFHAVRDASILAELPRAAAVKGTGKVIVGIVGKAHLFGMQRMWADGSWRAMPGASSKSKSEWRAALRAAQYKRKLLGTMATHKQPSRATRTGGSISPAGVWFPWRRCRRIGV